MRRSVIAAWALLTMATPVFSQSDECDRLYYLRNEFYNSKGLCFTRREAIRRFPENPSTCRYESSADLPLTERQHRVLEALRDREIALGCFRK